MGKELLCCRQSWYCWSEGVWEASHSVQKILQREKSNHYRHWGKKHSYDSGKVYRQGKENWKHTPHVVQYAWIWRWRRPPRYVPYNGTFVPYDGTYGPPDQGQMLDVWESQTTESALRWRARHVTILDRTTSQSWIGSWIRPGSLVKRVLWTMTTSWNDRSWSYARSTQAQPVTCSLSLSLIISILDHQPLLLVLTTLILVASICKLLNPCLSTWGWPSGLDHNSRIREFCYTSG